MIRFPHPRTRPAAVFAAGLLLSAGLHRGLLLHAFGPPGTPPALLAGVFAHGLHADLAALAWLLAPVLLWIGLAPRRWLDARWHRRLGLSLAGLAAAVLLFGFIAEYFFFEEFDARFNVVAVDYLVYPKELLGDIRQEYPLWQAALLCLAVAAGAARLLGRLRSPPGPDDSPARRRDLLVWAPLLALLIVSAPGAPPRWSGDRVLDELSGNTWYHFGHAAATRNLPYADHYRTLPRAEAYARVRRLLAGPGTAFVSGPDSIERRIAGDPARPRRNVVVIIVESFGSQFWGALGARPSLTPRMDALAATGLLWTRLYANGDRTQRGLEGVLSSFPPLPGESIYHRTGAGPVATLARTLKADGYATLFVYGGRGSFDGMLPFARANGFDRFIEEKDYPHPAHVNVWGVSDEDMLFRALTELHDLHAAGKPFCATLLTVSNHKPYTYPEGRIPESPHDRNRVNAVRYTDWALGEFFARARREPFWSDTLFAVIADHGPKVYGKPRLPVRAHEIPLLILGPGLGAPRRLDQLASSLDVSPTLLGLIGRPYRSVFLGRDLLRDPGAGRAPMNHNHDSALLRDGCLATLGFGRTAAWSRYDPATRALTELATPDPRDREVERDAIALYQVADELFTEGRFCPAP